MLLIFTAKNVILLSFLFRIFSFIYFRITMEQKFTIIDEITREYRRFNAKGTQLTVRLLPPPEGNESYTFSLFIASVNSLCECALQHCDDSDMVRISIRN